MYVVHVKVFFYEGILDPKFIFGMHCDPMLRHVFGDASMEMEKNNDVQKNRSEGLKNIE